MRGRVAIELAACGLVAAGCSGAAFWGVAELRAALRSEAVAHAGELAAGEGPAVDRAPAGLAASGTLELAATGRTATRPSTGGVDAAAAVPWSGRFLGQEDEALLGPLRAAAISEVKLNRGGSSLSLRVDFENGARAACKPNQIHPHSLPWREVAAYRLNRLLGLSSVPPAIGRRFQLSDIVDHLRSGPEGHARVLAESVPDHDATVVVELSWWIPVIRPAMIGGFAVDSTDGVVTWKRALTIGEAIPPEQLELAAQISNLVLFDMLINNTDRWSGGNVRVSEDGHVLYFMDNTLSFDEDPNAHHRVRMHLERVQKFSRGLVDRVRRLEVAEVRRAFTEDVAPFGDLLTETEIQALFARRDLALRYIDQLIAANGDEAVLQFP